MERYPVQLYESSERDQPDKNVVLRSLPGNRDRYISSSENRPPSTILEERVQPTSMYKIENRYQPSPPKVLPKKADPKVYYINSKRTGESPIIKQDRESSFPVQSDALTIFLEPQVISQPVLYSIAGTKPTPITDRPISIITEQPSPTIYSMAGRPRTVDMSSNSFEVRTPITDKSPTLYSLAGNSSFQNEIPESNKQLLQPSPNVYSILGSPARMSRGTQVNTPSPVQPVPVLYTIVGNTPPSVNKEKENRPSPPPKTLISTSTNEANKHKVQQPISTTKPTLYTLVGKPNSPPLKENRSKPPARTKTPPPLPLIASTRPITHSIERKPEIIPEEIVSYPTTKIKRPPQPKESTIPKPELIIIPFDDEEPRRRHQVPRQSPPYANPEQSHRKPTTVTQYPPLKLPDYHSPYTNRTSKPYREQRYTNNPLPIVQHNHAEKKERPPLYEPRYRVERRHPHVTTNPTSLERYPVNTNPRASLWDNGYRTQTDDDDDEEYEQRINKKKRSYRTPRPRGPWIPVW